MIIRQYGHKRKDWLEYTFFYMAYDSGKYTCISWLKNDIQLHVICFVVILSYSLMIFS